MEDVDDLSTNPQDDPQPVDVDPSPPVGGGVSLLMLAAAAHQQLMKNRKGRR